MTLKVYTIISAFFVVSFISVGQSSPASGSIEQTVDSLYRVKNNVEDTGYYTQLAERRDSKIQKATACYTAVC